MFYHIAALIITLLIVCAGMAYARWRLARAETYFNYFYRRLLLRHSENKPVNDNDNIVTGADWITQQKKNNMPKRYVGIEAIYAWPEEKEGNGVQFADGYVSEENQDGT